MGNVKQVLLKVEDLEKEIELKNNYIQYLQNLLKDSRDFIYLSYKEFCSMYIQPDEERTLFNYTEGEL